MIYRRKKYLLDPSIVVQFNEHFNNTLLPTQLEYGARVVGRWMTTNQNNNVTEIFAIWEYDSKEDYEEIENKVKADIEYVNRVQSWYKQMGGRENLKQVFFNIEQDFLESTVI
jgi:NIPSNAP